MSLDAQQLRIVIDEALAAQRAANHPEVGEVVKEAISQTLLSFGIKANDADELAADFRHLRKWRKSVESATTLSFKVAVGTIVSGVLGALWMGVKVFVGKS